MNRQLGTLMDSESRGLVATLTGGKLKNNNNNSLTIPLILKESDDFTRLSDVFWLQS